MYLLVNGMYMSYKIFNQYLTNIKYLRLFYFYLSDIVNCYNDFDSLSA